MTIKKKIWLSKKRDMAMKKKDMHSSFLYLNIIKTYIFRLNFCYIYK